MPTFAYRAVRPDGTTVEDRLEAAGRQEALRAVEARGLAPVHLDEQPAGGKPPAAVSSAGALSLRGLLSPAGLAGAGRVTPRMLENFTRLLSSLLAAGVPFSRALAILHREATEPAAKAKWKEIHDQVVDGAPLSAAMARSPEVFPRVYVAMVEAGEAGGFLDVVLAQIADFQAREKDLKAKVLTALVYPAVLLVLAVAVIIFLLVFFIPRFQLVFKGFNAQLPLITRVIVRVSEFVRDYGLFAAIALGVGLYALRRWFTSPAGRRAWEGFLLRLPAVGPLTAQFAMARFCRMLGTLLGADVPLINALNVARRSIGNQILVDAVTGSIEEVRAGRPLGASLARHRHLFPGAIIEMITVSEESGRLDQELVRISTVTEAELDRHLKTTVAMAEPLLLFLIAAFIGTLFIGMLIPIFSLQDYIK
jgi:type II secretory pathway component PulF